MVRSRTVSTMVTLVIVLTGTAVLAVALGALVRDGFRHGDRSSDARVRARVWTGGAAAPGASGGSAGLVAAAGDWVEVTIANDGPDTALVALRLGRARLPAALAGPVARRTAGRRHRLNVAEQVVGAVAAGESAAFWLWADGGHRGRRALVSVGTSGRLRLHRIMLSGAERLPAEYAAEDVVVS